MQCVDQWKPSKFVYKNGRLIGSRDPAEVGVSSRLVADIIAECYDRSLKQHARGRLLDLGCGMVPLYASYRDYVTENICVDWKNTLHQNPYLDREVDITGDLPFAADTFNTIILSDVLEHIPTPEYLWREMERVLAPNGKLIMNVPFLYWLHEQPHDYYRYTEFALRRFVEGVAMRVIELTPMGGASEVLADIFAKSAVRLPRVGSALAAAAQWGASSLLKTKLGKKISHNTSGSFPLLYFLVAEKGPGTAP
jgi:SAM-dependent methyltransferase